MKAHWLLAAVLASGGALACEGSKAQTVQSAEDTGRFEVVRERAASDGRLQMRVRAERLEAADRIAQKLAEQKKSVNQRIATIEFIAMSDPMDGPTRRVIDNP